MRREVLGPPRRRVLRHVGRRGDQDRVGLGVAEPDRDQRRIGQPIGRAQSDVEVLRLEVDEA